MESVDGTAHRALAVEANNATWEILGRSIDEIDDDAAEEMTRRAYAAAYHWSRAEGRAPVNDARADWLLSRVWTVRGIGRLALRHARRCMEVCEREGLVDFDLAYAHEALARAHACLGDTELAEEHRRLAAAVDIADPEDRRIVEGDRAAEPWFGR